VRAKEPKPDFWNPSFWRNDRATAAIEFAILTPVFLLMFFGMVAYAIYFGASHSLQQLAADAARTAIAGISSTERNSLVAAYIANNADGYIFIDASNLTFEIADKANDPSQYLVILRYDSSSLPIWNMGVPLPLPQKTMVYASTIRRGGI
jgi:Flp pilus assembly protein TadG